MSNQSDLDRRGSQDSYQSLIEVDPSPVDETPVEYSNESYFPNNEKDDAGGGNTTPPFGAATLGLRNHGPAFYLVGLQRYSSYAFTIFTTFHIANTSLIPLLTRSVSASDPYLLLTRPYYQSLPFEPLLITLPLGLHIAAGLALRFYRRRQSVYRYGAESREERRTIQWPKLSGTSALGYILTPLVLGHAFVNRVLPLWYEGGSANVGLEYVSHGFARHPVISFAGFTVMVGVGSWHIVWGWAKWLGLNPASVSQGGYDGHLARKRRFYIVNGFAALVAGLWLAGGLGVVGRGGEATGWLAKEYDELYRRIPLVGHWL
ncbi:hypothetical protein EJ08DRAFT_585026 [Tothia fuscella]|uniref:Mitochondrial adapter protein MCP1 transmembrane domain-containing protein n=1 Tax=Tothia fuscella TaxID=1048955 RepID=A0A9P4NWS6_9PEZI|nr:hypothetical protein EJ08DRAFT_585026 [Tothia fuscella]